MKLFYVAVISLLLCACSHKISEKDVNDLIAKADKAIAAKNADEMATLLSDSVQVNVSISQNGSVQKMSFGKPAYINLLRQAWAAAEDYRYERINLKISLDGDKATISSDLKESMTMRGEHISSVSKETTVVVMEHGKPVISKMDSAGSM
jgi:hypothetical protein